MKKTININLGGLVFQIDEDAYDKLHIYIEALKRKFTDVEERTEIIQDIEYRFAELFGGDLNKTKEVVSLDMVKSAIATMGEPEEIEDELENNDSSRTGKAFTNENIDKKLFRDPDDKIFAGVLSGLTKYFGLRDAIWLRILMILGIIGGFGFPIIVYFILWFVMPEAKTSSERLQMNGDPINLDNIEGQVKKNINTDEIKRTTVRVANKFGELGPLLIKVLAIFFVLFFGFQLVCITATFLGGGTIYAMFKGQYISLFFESKVSFYLGLISVYLLTAIPFCFALYLAIKLLIKKKINWILSLSIAFGLFLLALTGVVASGLNIADNFKNEADQKQFVALQNPSIDELDIEFPYEKIKDDISLKKQFGIIDEDNDINIEGIKVLPNSKQIMLNAVELDIVQLRDDTIFKLSKKMHSRGMTIEDAENRIEKITHDFDQINETAIAIPKMMTLEDETKWRVQLLRYELQVPIGKRIYFGDNAKKVVDNVDFNGDFSKKDLANNTWEMTKNGLKCLTCEDDI